MRRLKSDVWLLVIGTSFMALLIFQAYWVYAAFRGEKIEYREKTDKLLCRVTDLLNEDKTARELLLQANELDKENKPVPLTVRDKLNTHLVGMMERAGELERFPTRQFYYGLLRNYSNSKTDTNCAACPAYPVVSNKPGNSQLTWGDFHKKHICLTCALSSDTTMQGHDKGINYEIGFYFPGEELVVLRQMTGWIICSFLCLLLLATGFTVITRRYKAELKLASIKTEFINTLTHEIQTPVFTIGMAARILKEKLNQPYELKDIEPCFRVISEQTRQLSRQAEKILELNSLEEGEVTLSLSIIDINNWILESLPALQMMVQKAGGNLVFEKGTGSNTSVMGDMTHLRNVLNSLVDNCIKYSDGPVEILVKVLETEKCILLSIKDNGRGISKEHLPHVFNKFYRVTSGNGALKQGFGLGLSYVKTIMELHGGTAEITTGSAKGITVTLRFPKPSMTHV